MAEMFQRRYLRFVGKLWETDEFEPGVGWETERIVRRPACAAGYALQLLDHAGDVLVETGVELRAGMCRSQRVLGMTSQRVVGYLPLHPAGRAVIFRRGERVLHMVEIAAESPRSAITSVDVDADGRMHVCWEAKHERLLWFNVVFVDAQRRVRLVGRELSDTRLVLATADLPGGPGCSLVVLATDGLRSAMARSEPFDLPEQPPRLMIMMPNDGDCVAPDQPISLLGHAHDAAGRALPDDQLVWSVDDRIIARSQRMALAGPFEPGIHRVELAYLSGGEIAPRSHVQLHVAERSPEQHAWRTISAKRTTDLKILT